MRSFLIYFVRIGQKQRHEKAGKPHHTSRPGRIAVFAKETSPNIIISRIAHYFAGLNTLSGKE